MWFGKLTTNGINKLPFVLSLSKDFIGVSLKDGETIVELGYCGNAIPAPLTDNDTGT